MKTERHPTGRSPRSGPESVFTPTGSDSYYKPTDSYRYSFAEIKNCINQHKHLPEVPPPPDSRNFGTGEIETNGVNVSEMNMILLKKIEE